MKKTESTGPTVSKTIHIEGVAKDIDLLRCLSDHWDFPHNFEFEDSSDEAIPGMFFRFYSSPEKVSLEEAVYYRLTQYFGTAEATGQATGYSEYTIEGFDVNSLTLGGHDLQEIVKSQGDSYLNILIDFVHGR